MEQFERLERQASVGNRAALLRLASIYKTGAVVGSEFIAGDLERADELVRAAGLAPSPSTGEMIQFHLAQAAHGVKGWAARVGRLSIVMALSGALAACILGAAGIVVFQALSYLSSGEWTSLSVLTGLELLELEWATSPTEWLGAHKILGKVPLSIGVLCMSILPMWLFGKVDID